MKAGKTLMRSSSNTTLYGNDQNAENVQSKDFTIITVNFSEKLDTSLGKQSQKNVIYQSPKARSSDSSYFLPSMTIFLWCPFS